jgi:hypothetical protein
MALIYNKVQRCRRSNPASPCDNSDCAYMKRVSISFNQLEERSLSIHSLPLVCEFSVLGSTSVLPGSKNQNCQDFDGLSLL